ncbi:unnamed protein product [Tenebrio molitor]|nr:unnamed protein product [Tenebrio molitor]
MGGAEFLFRRLKYSIDYFNIDAEKSSQFMCAWNPCTILSPYTYRSKKFYFTGLV